MNKKVLAFVLVGLFVLLQGRNIFGQTLLVAAASSMRDALDEAAAEFEKQSGHRALFTFDSSGALAHEIENGVPYDLYIAVWANFVQELSHRKLIIPGTSAVICKGRLVIIVRKDSSIKINKLRDITNFPLIAIANPQYAPFGKAAQEALQNAGVWLQLQNKILYAKRVAEVLELVEKGEVPVGIGSQSLSSPKADAQVEYLQVEDKLYTPPEIHAAIVKGTMHREIAKAFIDFLTSDRGKAILKKHNFSLPEE
ncbi:MAG TPA: molybdate ABC transporter substrate-binding protein [Candidatus Hypogeohydataceae bacterium YC41]